MGWDREQGEGVYNQEKEASKINIKLEIFHCNLIKTEFIL